MGIEESSKASKARVNPTAKIIGTSTAVLAGAFAFLYLAFGHVTPCGILKTKIKRDVLRDTTDRFFKQADNPFGMLGLGLADKIIDQMLDVEYEPRTPLECISELKNYKYETYSERGVKEAQKKYVGEFKDRKPLTEHGTVAYPDGSKYVGELKEGKPNGQGTHTVPPFTEYVGEFKDGLRHGQGTLTVPFLMTYVGEFKEGKRTGQATVTYPDGSKYVGEFKDGLRNGQGIEYSGGGSVLRSGSWENNTFTGR